MAKDLTRSENAEQIRQQYRDVYAIGLGITLVAIGIWIGSLIYTEGYGTNLYTEGMGVLVTILVLDRINQWRERQNTKKRLIREAGSRSNELAIAAVEWLRAENWLTTQNGLLKGAHLWSANLENANLTDANLDGIYLRESTMAGVDLRGAILKDANLRLVDLTGAQMGDVNLQEADLHNSTLQDAVLLRANLSNARLTYVDFSGTNLKEADLSGADITGAIFNEQTVLPDAQRTGRDADGKLIFTQYWTPNTDMTRYTNPSHPAFWRADS